MKNFLRGVEILSGYQEVEESGGICAVHDIIYTGFTYDPGKMTLYVEKTMELLGWHWDKECECWAYFT